MYGRKEDMSTVVEVDGGWRIMWENGFSRYFSRQWYLWERALQMAADPATIPSEWPPSGAY